MVSYCNQLIERSIFVSVAMKKNLSFFLNVGHMKWSFKFSLLWEMFYKISPSKCFLSLGVLLLNFYKDFFKRGCLTTALTT
jgi:hypothetical protein